jgi:hypothetical protein
MLISMVQGFPAGEEHRAQKMRHIQPARRAPRAVKVTERLRYAGRHIMRTLLGWSIVAVPGHLRGVGRKSDDFDFIIEKLARAWIWLPMMRE